MKAAKIKEVNRALREACEMMPLTSKKREEWFARASHLCADLSMAMLVAEAREKEPPSLSPEVQALIQAAEKVRVWLVAPSVKTPVLNEMQGALASALAPFTESAPKPLTPAEKYVQDGGTHCPHCGNQEISILPFTSNTEGIEAWHDVACPKCNEQWKEVFTLSRIESVEGKPLKFSLTSEG